ncbi:MAG: hypothetical protein KC492_24440 [Myxococcales bacterium]|nr:hypothetical protein [Myxococcales bacterium]
MSAGRPDRVLADYGFEPAASGPRGHYVTTHVAWRLHVVVLSELPLTRDTILLRLLGPPRVRLAAIRELLALPDDAWEKKVALPWLGRLRFEVPPDPASQSNEEREFIMETQAWFEQYQQQLRSEGRREGRDEGRREGRDAGRDEGRLLALTRLYARRLGRPLADAERVVLAERLERLGEDRLDEVVLELGADALAAWLADPAAR